jgi:hypothetical protein
MNEKQKNLEDRPSRSQANLQGDSRTLHYELGMLIQLARGFDTPDIQKNRIVKNAFIESFAIHCRALIFFLFGHWKERTVNGEILRFIYLNSNDVIAFDFHPGWVQDCPEHTKVMAEAKHQTDKHVAHITEERRELNQPGSPKESSWDLHAATTAIYSALDCFLAKAPSENFDATRLHEMKKLINGMDRSDRRANRSVCESARKPGTYSSQWSRISSWHNIGRIFRAYLQYTCKDMI